MMPTSQGGSSLRRRVPYLDSGSWIFAICKPKRSLTARSAGRSSGSGSLARCRGELGDGVRGLFFDFWFGGLPRIAFSGGFQFFRATGKKATALAGV
jgi:hypothetical protein